MASKLSGVAGAKRALQPPSPSPSNASNTSHGGTPSKRLKREDGSKRLRDQATPTPAAIAASQTSHGDELLTKLSYAVDFLKAKGAPKTLQEILDHLTLQHASEKQQRQFASLMKKNHPAINFLPGPKTNDPNGWRMGTYEFRAKIPGVKSKTTLLEYLQRKTDASKLDVKLLKDGWPDCDKAIDELEAAHRILVVRTKKDGHAKYIWSDQPSLFHSVDPEFRIMWQRVKLPDLDDIVRKLTAVGQKPASEDPRLKVKITEKAAKPKRKVNRSKKRQTNEHMNGILKDYSHLKKG